MPDIDMREVQIPLCAPEHVLFQKIGEEAVLLNLSTGAYYGLSEMGAKYWCLLQKHYRLQNVVEEIVLEYDATEEQVFRDLGRFVGDLQRRDLVRIER